MLLSELILKLDVMSIVYSIIIVTILSTAMLLNLQVLFNGAIFELYPDDFILGAILMFADVMWVAKDNHLKATSFINNVKKKK